MRVAKGIARCFLIGICISFIWARGEGSDVEEIQTMVRQWIALKQELARSQTEWQEHQALLTDEMRLLEKRRDVLKKRLARQDELAKGSGKGFAGLQGRRRALSKTVASLSGVVEAAEKDLRAWSERLPPLLVGPLQDSFRKLPLPDGASAAPAALAERLQLVFGIYAQLQQLTRSVHVGRMVLAAPDGRQIEMDVMFIGLGAAYAVSADDSQAAVGRSGREGWSWEWQNGVAPAVRQLFACYRKESPAAFVSVPIRLNGETP
ncbi:MAG: DUF3450 family protein [Lentisphaerae bacterium]|jgi:hypothetical protein|nr:DUF3450 family protein [Lentisphaerota bacterium]MBT4823163.1 DUF3450 family protein [Lentisphaerota bacterium]MBT5610449.1 DUF3450 family protein [Lentisphaerota bacterium]MBT7061040.1 DUF3450 family protein [Lentisphaerota bacterium]MBT7842175.1 DUF3450 family protein [Lentisphaerota bacterium]